MNNSIPPAASLLAEALEGTISYSSLKRACLQTLRSPGDELNSLAFHVAVNYSTGCISFQQADAIMNAAWGLTCQEDFLADNSNSIPDDMYEVFLAFDEGEYLHPTDGSGTDPEVKYTRPMIEAFLAKRVSGE